MEFAEALNRLRKEAGLSLSVLARRANCSKSEVGHAATGVRIPSEPIAIALDRALNASGMLVAIARSERLSRRLAPTSSGASRSGEGRLVLRIRIEGNEMLLRLDRRAFLHSGARLLAAALGLDAHEFGAHRLGPNVVVASGAAVLDVVARAREQWHDLVQIDNMHGPQLALDGVHGQLALIEALLQLGRGHVRRETARLAARYAESAAWLYEDLDDIDKAKHWTARAAAWAFEGGDQQMMAWAMYRKSQQAAAQRDPGQVIGLTAAVLAHEHDLSGPMRAALRVQQAHGFALDSDLDEARRLLDQAHQWAADDLDGDARAGHGSFCTHGYIELNRAACLATAHKPRQAVSVFQSALPTVPAAYRRDRAAYEIKLAAAHVMNGDPEQAAQCVLEALPTMTNTGSRRMIREVTGLAEQLRPHRRLPAVAHMLDATTAPRK